MPLKALPSMCKTRQCLTFFCGRHNDNGFFSPGGDPPPPPPGAAWWTPGGSPADPAPCPRRGNLEFLDFPEIRPPSKMGMAASRADPAEDRATVRSRASRWSLLQRQSDILTNRLARAPPAWSCSWRRIQARYSLGPNNHSKLL